MDKIKLDDVTYIVVVLGVVWAGMASVMNIVKWKNDLRNEVLGICTRNKLDAKQKRLIFEKDYRPLAWGVWLFLFVFALGIALMPVALTQKQIAVTLPEWIISECAAAFAVFAMVIDIWATFEESKLMQQNMKETEIREENLRLRTEPGKIKNDLHLVEAHQAKPGKLK